MLAVCLPEDGKEDAKPGVVACSKSPGLSLTDDDECPLIAVGA